jgi:transcriptional regulator with XRE-family HTH domain
MTIGQRIAKCRKNKNISQEKLAEMLEVSRQTVSKWETDVAVPDTGNMIWLSKIFEVSVEYIACGDEGEIYDAPLVDVKKNEPTEESTLEDDDEDDEEQKERLDRRKFWGFVLLMCVITALVRLLNPDILIDTNIWWVKPVIALVLAIPCLFGIKLLIEKK